jgi:hypothetical protein
MSKYKMLCPECKDLQAVIWCNDKQEAGLACGHRRTTLLLPRQPTPITIGTTTEENNDL